MLSLHSGKGFVPQTANSTAPLNLNTDVTTSVSHKGVPVQFLEPSNVLVRCEIERKKRRLLSSVTTCNHEIM